MARTRADAGPLGRHDPIRIVPHSGVQFLVYGFDLETTPRFSRTFIEHRHVAAALPDGTAPVELRPGWDDDDPDEGQPPFHPQGNDAVYDITKQKALEPFVDQWTPLPFLVINRDDQGREQLGPTNWCRVRVTAATDGEPGITHHVAFAFDTEIVKRQPNRPYVGPSQQDVLGEREFALATTFRDIAWFLSDRRPVAGTGEEVNHQEWVDRWIDELFVQFKTAQRGGRALRPGDREPLEHAARYVSFIQFLASAVPVPPVKLIDTHSTDTAVKPVNVDLVLDVGNSRTCGMLIETFPNQQRIDLGNSYILQLRDLSEPQRTYEEPFESDLQLAQAQFGREYLSRASMRARAFFWPSLVRVGPEAARFREHAEGTEGASGMSSPKRYLCDVESVNQEWRFQLADYGSNREPPIIDRAARRFVNARGDVLRQVIEERRFYERLAFLADKSDLERQAGRLIFSRSSFFTLMIAEIIVQTLSLINNPQMRGRRGEKDTPRRLTRMILTMPTAMPVREQRLLRSRATAAVKLVWDLMGWTDSPPPGLVVPEVHAQWDEASCAQFVYLYSEIAQKFGGNITDFMQLAGRERPFVEPDKPGQPPGPEQPSIRVASIDVGGGTTDVMITTYYVEQNRAIVPCQTFREGFRIAGEDVLREVIQQMLIPAIARHLRACGMARAREFLVDRFGSDRANMAEQDKHLRRQYVLRVLKPAGLALLAAYETAQAPETSLVETRTIGELISHGRQGASFEGRIADYADAAAAEWGAEGFRVTDVEVPIEFDRIRGAVEATLGDVFDNIAEAIHHFDCDVVLLSGRPTRLPATIDLFVNKLAVAPDRVIPLSNYPPGDWYPFGGSARFPIGDPKTATVVGCMLCSLAERQITNFTLYTYRLAMRSTANHIGVIERDGKMLAANVLFSNKSTDGAKGAQEEEATVNWFAPMPIGFRQLPIERWVATPIYRIKPVSGLSIQGIQRPVQITLVRELPDELAEYESKNFSAIEAMKEELRIAEAVARDGANVTRSFGLSLDTLGSEDGYWLDTGILNVS
ncbi:MAG TPA: virulence factor SrfB [Xanthobacteraceae bacterium]|nr:virulence factor SrfB [Xanthobacteraceae bacterium]